MVAASPLLTRIIPDGAMVEIDGDTGTVTFRPRCRRRESVLHDRGGIGVADADGVLRTCPDHLPSF
jgi:hypothetical protein